MNFGEDLDVHGKIDTREVEQRQRHLRIWLERNVKPYRSDVHVTNNSMCGDIGKENLEVYQQYTLDGEMYFTRSE